MKVVIFCGGQGMRLRDYSETIPKPMVPIGFRPVLWHLMRYYAHYGHTDFVLCLGYKGDVIKEYFLNYKEALSNDFVLSGEGKVELLHSDMNDWKVTFVDTGQSSTVGQRLRAVEKYVRGDGMFMANYADGLTDLPLSEYLDFCRQEDKIASFLCVRPAWTFHVVDFRPDGRLGNIRSVSESGLWINGGYFVFKDDVFRYLKGVDDLPIELFQRLLPDKQVAAYKHEGFWACMDTFREKQQFDEMHAAGRTPWQVWERSPPG